MLDIGWSELMVVGVLALLVVGPKELPRLLRTVGQFVGKARGIAREFQRSMEDAAREADLSELADLKRDMNKMTRVDFGEQAKRSSNSLAGAGKKPGAPVKRKPADAEAEASASEAPAAPASEPAAKPAETVPDRKVETAPPPDPAPRVASGE